MRDFRRPLACLLLVAASTATVLAHTPVEFLEVIAVEPARMIEHAVDLKSKFDPEKVQTDLQGPVMFARSVGCMGRAANNQPAYLNWFKIVKPAGEPVRELSVLDMVRGDGSKSLKIQNAEYLLSPSQLITSGTPDEIPDGLDHYKAYRIIDASALDRKVTLTNSVGPAQRTLGKPIFVCLAVREWHHDEYFSATHPSDCFVVYELDAHDQEQKFSTIDQFGLNELQSTENRWLCVRAALLRTTSN
ncbi:MAG: hypothetical protein HKN47_02745 [Pirellulaceae bacterium]|nr:hypothetical protein [Pirellulaceae bacterium]